MAGFRHECKFEINTLDAVVVRSRLRAVARADFHGLDGRYEVRSLYFDNPADKALREKIDGVNMREKFRIRYYNRDTAFIRLEKKRKCNGLTGKESIALSEAEARKIAEGNFRFMVCSQKPLLVELYSKIMAEGLAPKTIVDYTREAFVYPPGNVRVTLDYNIRTGLGSTNFLNPDSVTIPAGDDVIIMEVKWDAFLPDIIKDAVQLTGCMANAWSKYAACRIYG